MPAPHMLVIEDNPDFAAILETVLRLLNYPVEVYDTLAAGMAAISLRPPRMLLLDGQLPDGEGYDLYQQLRRQPATRDLPILLLSVSDDVYDQARAASSSDPNLYVGLKPMPLEEIQAIVQRVAGKD